MGRNQSSWQFGWDSISIRVYLVLKEGWTSHEDGFFRKVPLFGCVWWPESTSGTAFGVLGDFMIDTSNTKVPNALLTVFITLFKTEKSFDMSFPYLKPLKLVDLEFYLNYFYLQANKPVKTAIYMPIAYET